MFAELFVKNGSATSSQIICTRRSTSLGEETPRQELAVLGQQRTSSQVRRKSVPEKFPP